MVSEVRLIQMAVTMRNYRPDDKLPDGMGNPLPTKRAFTEPHDIPPKVVRDWERLGHRQIIGDNHQWWEHDGKGNWKAREDITAVCAS